MGELGEQDHPLHHLRDIVRQLCANFGHACTPELLAVWEKAFAHRTDKDLDEGFIATLKHREMKRMPTTGQFLNEMPLMRVRRDGTRPE